MRTNQSRTASLALLVVIAAGAAACSSGGASPSAVSTKQQVRQDNRAAAVKAAVVVSDQASSGYSIIVSSVTYPDNSVSSTSANQGVVALAPLVNGEPGDYVGYTPVHQRTTNNVTITVNVRLTSGTYVVALFSGHKEPSGSEHPLASQNFTLTVG